MELTYFDAYDESEVNGGIERRRLHRADIFSIIHRDGRYEVWYWRTKA